MTGPQLQAHYDALGSDQRARTVVRELRRRAAAAEARIWPAIAGLAAGAAVNLALAPLIAGLLQGFLA